MVSEVAAGRERTRDEAAAWAVRLTDPHEAEDFSAFEVWRDESVEHEIAFERASVAWERSDRLKALRSDQFAAEDAILRAAELDAADAVQGGRMTSGFDHVPADRRWRGIGRRGMALVLSLAFACMLGGLALLSLMGAPAYATGLGERRLIGLDGGGHWELNTESKILERFGRHRRMAELVRGEALICIARSRGVSGTKAPGGSSA